MGQDPAYPDEKLDPALVARNMAGLFAGIMQQLPPCAYMVVGGDTVLALLKSLNAQSVDPIAQLLPGVVLSACVTKETTYPIITKSGSFGDVDIIAQLNPILHL